MALHSNRPSSRSGSNSTSRSRRAQRGNRSRLQQQPEQQLGKGREAAPSERMHIGRCSRRSSSRSTSNLCRSNCLQLWHLMKVKGGGPFNGKAATAAPAGDAAAVAAAPTAAALQQQLQQQQTEKCSIRCSDSIQLLHRMERTAVTTAGEGAVGVQLNPPPPMLSFFRLASRFTRLVWASRSWQFLLEAKLPTRP